MSNRTIIGKRGYTYGIQVELVVWECPVQGCGIVYGIPKWYADTLRSEGGAYYCPNGHCLSWDETDADRERKKREVAERQAVNAERAAAYQREEAERQRRTASALRGHLTRMRNRIANGICPVPGCKRSGFSNVLRHIASKHPDWHAEHSHDFSDSGGNK